MNTRRNQQVACPICRAGVGRPCRDKQDKTLQGVHFQRTTALRATYLAAMKSLYTPFATR